MALRAWLTHTRGHLVTGCNSKEQTRRQVLWPLISKHGPYIRFNRFRCIYLHPIPRTSTLLDAILNCCSIVARSFPLRISLTFIIPYSHCITQPAYFNPFAFYAFHSSHFFCPPTICTVYFPIMPNSVVCLIVSSQHYLSSCSYSWLQLYKVVTQIIRFVDFSSVQMWNCDNVLSTISMHARCSIATMGFIN